LPKGLLSASNVLFFSVISLGVFLLAVFQLAPVCRYLWPLVVIPFVVYPYTKRFTWLSHFVLGLSLGLAPVGAWIAIANSFTPDPFLIGAAVLCWVAGFDILYAIQDINFDRRQGLHSIPARFGIETSLMLTKLLHMISVLLLLWVGLRLGLGLFYYAGILIAAGLLAYENSLVKPNDVSKLNMAFFTMNGVISVIVFCFVAIEVIFGRRAIV
jgi:4-hydroxybenzoate polyprenyltransferase